MAEITISDLEDRVVDALRAKAESHGHSLEEEARELLARGAGPSRGERTRLADEVRRLTLPGPQSDSTELIREDRDSR